MLVMGVLVMAGAVTAEVRGRRTKSWTFSQLSYLSSITIIHHPITIILLPIQYSKLIYYTPLLEM
jgi:hypothetical protein